ncbi:MAG: hypothetical protein PUD39_06345 [Bacteroidales bacterium]|nr:hypothetical protein [Bacteroidales bacterium]
MKKIFTLTAVLTLCSLWSDVSAITPRATTTSPYKSCYERVTDALHQRQARRAAKAGIEAATNGAIKLDGADGATTFGWLSTPDGVEWYYAAEIYRTELPKANPEASYTDETISGFKLSVYDENYQPVGTVNGKFELNENETRIAAIDFGDVLSKNFFNNDSKYEVMVLVNANTSKYINNTYTYVYSITTNSNADGDAPIIIMPGMQVAAIDTSTDSWSEKLLMVFDVDGYVNPDQSFVVASADHDAAAVRTQRFTIYNKAGYGSEPKSLGFIDLPEDKASYSDGLPVILGVKDGTLHVASASYEKPFFSDMANMELSENNSFVLTRYTMPVNGNGKLTQVGTTKVPVVGADGDDSPFSLYGVGQLDYMDDMQFDAEGNPTFVVTREKWLISTDSHADSYYVYNSAGELLHTIFEDADNVQAMSDVKGYARQNCFISTDGSGNYIYHFVDMDTYNNVLTMPATVDGNTVTTQMDRVADAKYGYKYVAATANAENDDQGRACEAIYWIAPDGRHIGTHHIYLGTNVATAVANISADAVSRFLVDTDDDYEYMYLVKRYTGESSKTKTELYIVDENSEPVFTYLPEDADTDIFTVWTFNLDCKPTIAVVLRDTNDVLSIELFSLPLNIFQAGGSGTAEDPYLISTIGDLMQISNAPDAHFRVANDIDAENVAMPHSEAIFTGSIDGGNHVISNLSVASTGLLGNVVGTAPTEENTPSTTVIKDLILYNPSIDIDKDEPTSGLLAGSVSQYARISNVHVYGLNVEDSEFDSAFGAIAGELTNFASASEVSVNDSYIILPKGVTVGGIAGRLRTSATINASAFNGSITADNEVGGIVGNTFDMSHGTAVTNCHVSADITAQHTLGGIIGSDDHSLVANNVAHGTLKAIGSKGIYGPCIGGIIGSLAYLSGSGNNINGNLAAQHGITFTMPEPIAGVEQYASETAHRIVGETDFNAYGEGQDGYLRNNFALEPMPIINNWEIYAGPDGVEGGTITADELNKSFLQGIGFVFGTDATSPWDELSASTVPQLYYEEQPKALTADSETAYLNVGDYGVVIFTLVGGSSAELDIEVSNAANVIADVETSYPTDDTASLTFNAVAEGTATITASFGSFTRTFTIVVKESAGISDIIADDTAATLTYDGTSVRSSVAGTRITVYNAAGAVVAAAETSVDLSSLSHGIYIAATATEAIKIAK